jgi:hypothetical protein
MNWLKIKKLSSIVTILLFLLFLSIIPVYNISAQEEFSPITTVPGVISKDGGLPAIETFLQNIFVFLIGAAAVIAVVQITIGGVQYMTSNAVGSLEDAKSKIRMAIIGLLLILSTYIILQQINPELVNIKLSVPSGGGGDDSNELSPPIGPID